MSLSTRRLLAQSRARAGGAWLKAFQSTVSPSAICSMASSRTASDMLHLLGETLHGAGDGHAGLRCRGPAQHRGQLVVRIEHLEAADDGFAVRRGKPLQRRFIALEILGADRRLEWRCRFVLDAFRQPPN